VEKPREVFPWTQMGLGDLNVDSRFGARAWVWCSISPASLLSLKETQILHHQLSSASCTGTHKIQAHWQGWRRTTDHFTGQIGVQAPSLFFLFSWSGPQCLGNHLSSKCQLSDTCWEGLDELCKEHMGLGVIRNWLGAGFFLQLLKCDSSKTKNKYKNCIP